MSPTVERPPKRVFHVRLLAGDMILIEADTVCDQKGEGLIFKRDGEIVGRVQAPYEAWWVEERPA